MISDGALYQLALFLGAAAMLMIVVYHFLEVNSDEHQQTTDSNSTKQAPAQAALAGKLNVNAGSINANGRSVAQ